MSFEQSITMAFIGSGLILAYIGSCIKEDEEKLDWSYYVPIGIRTFFYFAAIGMCLFSIGVQTPLLIENEIYVNTTAINTADILRNNIGGGINIATKIFYGSIIILFMLVVVYVIQSVLLKRKMKKEDDEY
jgi:hypothetical protein